MSDASLPIVAYQLRAITQDLADHERTDEKVHEDHEDRIRMLEKAQAKATVVLSICAALGAAVLSRVLANVF